MDTPTDAPETKPFNPMAAVVEPSVPVLAPTPAPISAPPPPPVPKPAVPVQKSPFRWLIPALIIGIGVLLLVLLITRLVIPRLKPSTATTEEKPAQKTQITYWGLWEPSTVMDQLINQFETANPGIDVVYQQQSIKDYRERLQNALTNGNGPDVFRFHASWTPMFSAYLEPIPETTLTTSEYESLFYPVAKQWLKSGKSYVGIPLMHEGLGLFYNQSMFEAAGTTPPKTWEELGQTAALLTTINSKDGTIKRSGIALGTTSNVDNWSDIVGLMLLQNEANPAKPNDEAGQGALEYYVNFSRRDKIWDETLPASTIAFANEKVAMIIAPSWRAHEIRAMNPNLRFAIAPLPQLPNVKPVSWASIWAEGVSSKSNKKIKEASWKFLSYLNQKENLRAWYASASKQRLFGEIFARTDMASQLSQDPYVGAFLSQASEAKSWYLNSRTFDNGPNDKISKYYEDAINAMIGGDTATEVLNTVEQGITQVMGQYRL